MRDVTKRWKNESKMLIKVKFAKLKVQIWGFVVDSLLKKHNNT